MTLKKPSRKNTDKIMNAVDITECQRVHFWAGLDELDEHFCKVFVTLDAKLILREVKISHHIFDRYRYAALFVVRVLWIKNIGSRRVYRGELRKVTHDDFISSKRNHGGGTVCFIWHKHTE